VGALVSICIPVRDGSRWIDEAIDSVFAQSYSDIELVVVDDGSRDDTLERVRARSDERVRAVVNENPAGPAANHSRCVEVARGELVKFLHHDDVLYPSCVERMAGVLETHPNVGLVFSRRDVLLEDPHDAGALRWRESYGDLHARFEAIEAVTRGSDVLRQYVPALRGPHVDNWIGEPSAVMVRRSCFDRVGLFNSRMRLTYDLEMWLRIAAAFDVGFIDEPLVGYRHHSSSWTAATARTRTDWLDLLWMLEGLLQTPGLETHRRQLERFRRIELARTVRRQVRRLLRRNWDLAPLREYLAYRAATSAGRPATIHA
jgi:glycosyltransferase involved in cell wall biosynthesis